ncbi:hypothetical protein RJY99_003557 [Vibrio vulnificus]|nr:hypothetical protein [Vibrio vulnificus]ELC9582605.1 hypothetical protein [Vibrio vulnificus]
MIFAFFLVNNTETIWIKTDINEFNYAVSEVLTDEYHDATIPLVIANKFTLEFEFEVCKNILVSNFEDVRIYESIDEVKAVSCSSNELWFDSYRNQWELNLLANPILCGAGI